MMTTMRALALGIVATALGGCGAKLDGSPLVDADIPEDGPPDGDGDDAAQLGAFGTPALVGVAATAKAEDDGTLSSDGLELVFAVVDAADGNRKKLFYAQRASTAAAFETAVPVSFTATGVGDETPRFSADDKTLYFGSTRAPSLGGLDIYSVSHASPGNNWGTPAAVPGVSSANTDKWFATCGAAGNRYLVIRANDLAEGVLDDPAGPTTVAELSSAQSETGTFLTADCTTIMFASTRNGSNQIFIATRPSETSAWNTPVPITNSPDFAAFTTLGGNQQDPWISSDGRQFIFVSDVSGTNDVYITTR
jgi:hypothetical protein